MPKHDVVSNFSAGSPHQVATASQGQSGDVRPDPGASHRSEHEGAAPAGPEDLPAQAQSEIEQSRLAAIVMSAENAIFSKTLEGIIETWNPSAERIFGYTVREAVGKPASMLFSPDRIQEEEEILVRLRRGERVSHRETQRVRKDGAVIDVSVIISPVRDATGRVVGVSSIVREITDELRVQKELERTESRFRATFEQAAVGMAHIGLDGRWVRINQKLCDIAGYSREEMLGLTVGDFAEPRDAGPLAAMARILSGDIQDYAVEKRHVRPNGAVVWINFTLALARDVHGIPDYFIAVVEDVTERKNTERALRESEQRLRTMADSIPMMVWTAGADGQVDYVSQRWTDYTGTAYEYGGLWHHPLHPDDAHRVVQTWRWAIEAGEVYECEQRIRRLDGAYRWHLCKALPVHDESGAVVKWYGTAADIDEQVRAHVRLAQAHTEVSNLNVRLQRAMQETHHRVKNNLQLIAAVLDMARMEYGDALPMAEVVHLQRQVTTLAGIHDILTQNAADPSDRAERISVKQVLTRLLAMLESAAPRFRFSVEIQDVSLSTQRATSLALVLNELVSNAMKHGRSSVYVVFRLDGELATLVVEDDGPGLPPEFDIRFRAKTGLTLVDTLVRHDLQGDVELSDRQAGGARARIQFSISRSDEPDFP